MTIKILLILSSILYIVPAYAMENQKRQIHIIHDDQVLAATQELKSNPYALLQACQQGDYQKVEMLIALGADVNAQEKVFQKTALYYACLNGYPKIVQLLVDNGANLRLKIDQDGNTLLHDAATYGHTETVKVLLQNGAAPSQNTYGYTPLHFAVNSGSVEIAEALLSQLNLPQPELLTKMESESSHSTQEWDLQSLALMNILSNIEAFDARDLHHVMQKYPSLLSSYKKIAPFVDLNNKKIRRLLITAETSDLADYCDQVFIKQINDLINLESYYGQTALQSAEYWARHDLIQFLKSVKKAKSFEQLPEEIQEIAICNLR